MEVEEAEAEAETLTSQHSWPCMQVVGHMAYVYGTNTRLACLGKYVSV